jgi:lipid-A-disaccharide synthase
MADTKKMKILVSALEPSSNLHLKEVLRDNKEIELFGIFSSELGNPLYDTTDVAIMGFIDAIKKYRWFSKVADEMVELAKDVDKVLLMDSSGFNLPLAKKIKTKYPHIEIIYYILPQIWASRKYRVKDMELYCDKILAILPFEIDYYKQGKAKYVGHPLLDEIKYFKTDSIKNNTIAFMPGSREGEIKRLLPIYKEVRERLSHLKAVIIIPKVFSDKKIKTLYGDLSDFEISRDTQKTLYNCEFAFICSGTATLESALIGTPFSLNYIASSFDYFIAKYVLKIKQIGLANIMLSHYNNTILHKELIQKDVTVENLLKEYQEFNNKLFLQKSNELRVYLAYGSALNVVNYLTKESNE